MIILVSQIGGSTTLSKVAHSLGLLYPWHKAFLRREPQEDAFDYVILTYLLFTFYLQLLWQPLPTPSQVPYPQRWCWDNCLFERGLFSRDVGAFVGWREWKALLAVVTRWSPIKSSFMGLLLIISSCPVIFVSVMWLSWFTWFSCKQCF